MPAIVSAHQNASWFLKPLSRKYAAEPLARLLAQFEFEGTCFVWRGRRSRYGYGCHIYEHKEWATHRLMYTLCVGPITPGKNILHKCDNRACGHPQHLYEGTQQENMLDRWRGHTRQHLDDIK